MQEQSTLRAQMVESQLVRRGIHDVRVLEAMGATPRHLFVPPHLLASAYADGPLPIGHGQTISQPYMVAVTCQCAQLEGAEKVLEIGGGSGYQAAVLAALARDVVTVERVAALATQAQRNLAAAGISNVRVVLGDGSSGYPRHAPYDAILVAAAAPRIPQSLIDQLAPAGRLVIPVGPRHVQTLTVLEKGPDGALKERSMDPCVFVPLIGKEGWDEDR